MALYKCEVEGCGKYFSSRAKLKKHQTRMHGKPASGDDNEDGEVTPPTGDGLKIKPPATKAKAYHCSDCGADVTKGQEVCPECGERLVWDGVD